MNVHVIREYTLKGNHSFTLGRGTIAYKGRKITGDIISTGRKVCPVRNGRKIMDAFEATTVLMQVRSETI